MNSHFRCECFVCCFVWGGVGGGGLLVKHHIRPLLLQAILVTSGIIWQVSIIDYIIILKEVVELIFDFCI